VAGDSEWTSKASTDEIRAIAKSDRLQVSYKIHAMERIAERSLIMSDVLYVLKNGFVYDEPVPSTRAGYSKYNIESRSPNSGSRAVRVVVIPDKKSCLLKIITVMWIDEKETKSGTILGEEDE
jgi:hypothetical protein